MFPDRNQTGEQSHHLPEYFQKEVIPPFVGHVNTILWRLWLQVPEVKKEQFSVTKKFLFSAVSSLSFGAEGYQNRTYAVTAGMWWIQTAQGWYIALESRLSTGWGCTLHKIVVHTTEGKTCPIQRLLLMWCKNVLVGMIFDHTFHCLGLFLIVCSLQQHLFFSMVIKVLGGPTGVIPELFQEFWTTDKEKFSQATLLLLSCSGTASHNSIKHNMPASDWGCTSKQTTLH